MKVKEVIEQLEHLDPEAHVYFLIALPNKDAPEDVNEMDYYWALESIGSARLTPSAYGDRKESTDPNDKLEVIFY